MNAKEMYEYCRDNNLCDAWVYLYRNWYTWRKCCRWAKSAIEGKVPTGKTTMMIEAHWKVLKRTHLYHHNRARLDLVTYVILVHYYKKLAKKYQTTVVYRQETTTFEKRFTEQWKRGLRAAVSGTDYGTDLDRWVCGCPAFIQSRVCQCKHLVKAYAATSRPPIINRHQFIQRCHTPPLIKFLPVSQTKTIMYYFYYMY